MQQALLKFYYKIVDEVSGANREIRGAAVDSTGPLDDLVDT